MKGYYNGFAYMGFVPSIGKYQQFESENASVVTDAVRIILVQLMKDIVQKQKDQLTEILLAKVGTKYVFYMEEKLK